LRQWVEHSGRRDRALEYGIFGACCFLAPFEWAKHPDELLIHLPHGRFDHINPYGGHIFLVKSRQPWLTFFRMRHTPTDIVRPSLVDVFENFFGARIETLLPATVNKLPRNQLNDLVEVIDHFLILAKDQKYPPETVMLDSLNSPIIVPADRTTPITKRRAKQVALNHHEVVIPLQPLKIDYLNAPNIEQSRTYPATLLEWTRQNHVLLRSYVFSVAARANILQILGDKESQRLVAELALALSSPEFKELRLQIVPPQNEGINEEAEQLDNLLFCVLTDSLNANTINGNLAFLDQDAGHVYETLVKGITSPKGEESTTIQNAQLLQALNLPAIDDLPDNDFVAIRSEAEDFEEFRTALGQVLAKTTADISNGKSLFEAFRNNLDDIQLRADILRREIKNAKTLRKYFRASAQTVSLGALSAVSAAAASDFVSGEIRFSGLLARFLTTIGVGTLLSTILYKPPQREARLLRFYNVLLNKPTSS